MPRTTGKHTQAIRLIHLLRRLQGRPEGVSFADLQTEFDVSRSQIRRDLIALEEAGTRIAIEQEHGRYGRARVRLLDADSTSIPVTRSERYALLAVRGFTHLFQGSQLHTDMESVFDKVQNTMPARARNETRALAAKIIYQPSGGAKTYTDHEHIIDVLVTGVLMERLVAFTYRQRSGRKSSGTFAPYAIVIYKNGLYVIAQRTEDADGNPITQSPRVFAIERFVEAEWIRRSTFTYPPDFRAQDHFDGAFGLISGRKLHHVIVEFEKPVQVEARTRRWHHSQVTTPLPAGRTRVEFEVTSLREVVSWVLEWGPTPRSSGPTSSSSGSSPHSNNLSTSTHNSPSLFRRALFPAPFLRIRSTAGKSEQSRHFGHGYFPTPAIRLSSSLGLGKPCWRSSKPTRPVRLNRSTSPNASPTNIHVALPASTVGASALVPQRCAAPATGSA